MLRLSKTVLIHNSYDMSKLCTTYYVSSCINSVGERIRYLRDISERRVVIMVIY